MAGTIVSDVTQDGTGNSTSTTSVIKGSAKAWVNFTGSSATNNGSFNISSLTRTTTGSYVINFTTAMPNSNYVIVTGANPITTATAFSITSFNTSTTQATVIIYGGTGGTLQDANVYVAVFSN